jgi:hypothetical protein
MNLWAPSVWIASLLFQNVTAFTAPVPTAAAATPTVHFAPIRGKVRIEGTSNLDNWQVECRSVSGFLEADPGFPRIKTGQTAAPRAEAWLEVKSLKSVERDGKPFSNKMDGIMHDALRSAEHPRIYYRLSGLVAKRPPQRADALSEFEAQGLLVVAGVTNEVTMTLSVARSEPDQIRISGRTILKMTDFKVDPPAPKIALGLIKTDDEVKLTFEWVLKEQL